MSEHLKSPLVGGAERRLIVNADDFGLSPAVNRGIMELHAAGAITSASLLMNLPATTDALARSAGTDLDIGVHLNLTVGSPLARSVPSLLGADGQFNRLGTVLRRLASGHLRLAEVEREWAAQIEALLATGRRLTHIDSHVHLHAWPRLSGVAFRLARRYGIGAVRLRGHGLIFRQVAPIIPTRLVERWRFPFFGSTYSSPVLTSNCLLVLTALGSRCTVASLRALLRDLPPGLTELVTHPGYVDDELRRLDPLQEPREVELRLLSGTWWPEALAATGTRLTTFLNEVPHMQGHDILAH
jgi:predicted glycoside hydrolase/deacetylase ChbG (UPF0249 family)